MWASNKHLVFKRIYFFAILVSLPNNNIKISINEILYRLMTIYNTVLSFIIFYSSVFKTPFKEKQNISTRMSRREY